MFLAIQPALLLIAKQHGVSCIDKAINYFKAPKNINGSGLFYYQKLAFAYFVMYKCADFIKQDII